MAIAVGQFTIYDFHDVYSATTPPTNPQVNQVWLDTSTTPPVMKTWNGTEWLTANDYVSGGTNLLYNTSKMKDTSYWYINKASGTANLELVDDSEVGKAIKFTIGSDIGSWCYFGNNSHRGRKFEVGQDYTVSFMAKADDVRKINLTFQNGNANAKSIHFGDITLNTGWKRYEVTAKATSVGDENLLYITAGGSGVKTIHITKLQLETGNRASDYSPAPEDLDSKVTTVEAKLEIQAEQISQRVTKTDYSKDKTTMEERLTTAEAKIVTNADSIKQTVTKTEWTSDKQTINNAISGKADTSTVNALSGRLSTAETSITSLSSEISLKASKTDVYTKSETDSKVDGIEIGGENYIRNSGNFTHLTNWVLNSGTSIKLATKDGYKVIEGVGSIRNDVTIPIQSSTTYIYSAEVMFSLDTNIADTQPLHFWMGINSNTLRALKKKTLMSPTSVKANTWTRIVIKLETIDSVISGDYFKVFMYGGVLTTANKYWIKNIKFEKGTKVTDWTPSSADIFDRIESAEAEIQVNADSITQTVKKSDYTGETLVSMINQTADTIKIAAKNIQLSGSVTFESFDSSTQNKITNIENTASSANTNAGNAQNTANSAQSSANTAQNTANNASNAASSAQSSANTANSKLDTWSHPTDKTTINGGKIMTGSITAQQIAAQTITAQNLTISDFTNLCQVNEQTNTNGYTVVTVDGYKYFRFGNETSAAYYGFYFASGKTSSYNVGDRYRFSFYGYASKSVAVTFMIRVHYVEGGYTNLGTVGYTFDTTKKQRSVVLPISNGLLANKTISSINIFVETNNVSGYCYMRNIVIKSMTTAELIVDGSITANMITSGTFKGANFEAGGSGTAGLILAKDASNNITFSASKNGVYAKNITFVDTVNFDGTFTTSQKSILTSNGVSYSLSSSSSSYSSDDSVSMGANGVIVQNTYRSSSNGVTSVTQLNLTSNQMKITGVDASNVSGTLQIEPNGDSYRIRLGGSGDLTSKFVIQGTGDSNFASFSKTATYLGDTTASEKTLVMRAVNTSTSNRAGMYINTTNFGLYDWQKGKHIIQYNCLNGFMKLANVWTINGYYSDKAMMADHGNSNVTVNALGGTLYVGYENTTAVSVRANLIADKTSSFAGTMSYTGSSYGTNYIMMNGTGDGISYTACNVRMRLHYGLGFATNDGSTVNAVIDSRNGRFIGKSAYWHNSSKSLKSDVRAIVSEKESTVARMYEYDTIDNVVTMEMIEDFLDTVNIKTYISDYKQIGVTQDEHDDSQAHIKQLGYIADEFAQHPLFEYIGEMIGGYHAINTTALTSAIIAGYQSEKRKRLMLEDKVATLEEKLILIEEKLGRL